MQKFVNRLHDNGQQYIVIVDAGIANVTSYPAYDQGLELDIFITRNATGIKQATSCASYVRLAA